MAKKVKDMAVVVGQYQKDGETKNRYMNIGSMMQNDDGSFFLILDRTFNPAGVPNPDNRSSCVVSLFDSKQNNQSAPQGGGYQSSPSAPQPRNAAASRQPASSQAGAGYGAPNVGDDFLDDDVPF